VPVIEHRPGAHGGPPCADLALDFLTENPQLQLAINISGLTASDQSWLRRMSALLKGRPDVAKRLIVEVTETSALIDIEESARFLQTIRELGCRVAVDDFGAGYTSFRHLKALTLDIVKIDGSFVKNLAGNVDNQLFIRNLMGLADTYAWRPWPNAWRRRRMPPS
jgi:EAL domain-containing protein (putative c-di-GMP-specific phosphodiesterase class I)